MNARQLAALLAVSTSLTAYSAYAASFEVTNGQTVSSTQSLSTGETGLVDQGGAISLTTGDGIDGSGNNETIVNNGTIATDNNHVTILLEGNNSAITNNGSLSTGGTTIAPSMAIAFGSNNNTLINNGAIVNTTTDSGRGMDIDAGANTGNLLINNGTISTSGTNSFGMLDVDNSASNNTLINNGTITTTNTNAGAISTAGIGDTLINNGAIHTSGTSANGMNAGGINSTLVNNGVITMSNSNSLGMIAGGTGTIATNNGTISGTAFNTDGMSASVSATTLINNGKITETGTFADGIGTSASTSGQTLVNNGTITVNGTGGGQSPINNFSTNSTVINNGTLISTGSGASAITNNAAGNTVLLGADSTTIGNIVFNGSGNALQYDLTRATDRAGSVIYFNGSVTGTATTSITNPGTLPAGAHIVQSGNNVAVVTPDQFASSSQTVTQTLDYTGDIITQRFETAMLGDGVDFDGGTQYAAASINDASPASGFAVRDHNMAWTEAFGSYQERPDDGDTSYTQAKAAGVLAGIDMPQNDSGIRSGLYVGGITGSTDIGKDTFHTIDSDGALAGGYLGKSFGGYFVSGQLATGLLHNGSERDTGVDMASAGYDSIFVSPSLTVMRPIPEGNIMWMPQATLRYTSQWDTAYTESGSVENEHVDGHNINTLEARALMEAHFNEMTAHDGIIKPSVRLGAQYQTFIGSRSVDVNTFGTNINFDPSGGNNYVDGVIGGTVAYKLTNGPELYADGEGDIGLNKGGLSDNFGITGRLGARWKF